MKEETLKKSLKHPEETESYWRQHKSDCIASGLSRKRYCRENGVNCDRFNYWFNKLLLLEETAQSRKESPGKKGMLLPVHLVKAKPDSQSTPLCVLNLKNGHHVVIYDERALSLLLEQWG